MAPPAAMRHQVLGHSYSGTGAAVAYQQPDGFRHDARTTPSASTGPGTTVYLGIGAGLGGAILIAIIFVICKILQKRSEHRKAMAQIDQDQSAQMTQQGEAGNVPRPVSIARRGSLVPLHLRSGWDALGSIEDMRAQYVQGPPVHVSFAKRMKPRGIPLKRLKHLSAIMESPRDSPPVNQISSPMPTSQPAEQHVTRLPERVTTKPAPKEDVFACNDDSVAKEMPSSVVREPHEQDGSVQSDEGLKPPRSKSLGSLVVINNRSAMGHRGMIPARPNGHTRSISLGSLPPSRPPSAAVPPLPVVAPHSLSTNELIQQVACLSRTSSSSSHNSASSSVLATSPLMKIRHQKQPLSSPTVEEAVASDDGAQLKAVPNSQWTTSQVAGPRIMPNHRGELLHNSIRSNAARYSTSSLPDGRFSSCSITSDFSFHRNRPYQPQIEERVKRSRNVISPSESPQKYARVQKVSTPKRASRGTSVSENGSPAERNKTHILRDISGNSLTPVRRISSNTLTSSQSSNGNPFQWDLQPPQKPSALKGSPNARKGHKRQNCVRISTLTPQVLGPPSSKSTSPYGTPTIEEESGDSDYFSGARPTDNRRRSSASAPNLRIQTLRASLTPSSPTLSTWISYQNQNIAVPRQGSESNLSVSPVARAGSRQSCGSSLLNIPTFPSPGKVTISPIQLEQPSAEFYGSRPSMETVTLDSSPATNCASSDLGQASSPISISTHANTPAYDPAYPFLSIPAPKQAYEYDPTSPAYPSQYPQHISHAQPNNTENPGNAELSTESPSCSPRSTPVEIQSSKKASRSSRTPNSDHLTSANASALMAQLENVNFPGAPVLLPPDTVLSMPSPTIAHQLAADRLQPLRAAPPPPGLGIGMSHVPSPLRTHSSSFSKAPQGPRSEPPRSVLKNAMALRRMNSEMEVREDRESRRYVRLGREASPELPFYNSPDPNESCNELFDFDFASGERDVHADHHGAWEREEESDLDNVDFDEIEHRLRGALAGVDGEDSKENTPPMGGTDQKRSSSVWDDGELFWAMRGPGRKDVTPKNGVGAAAAGNAPAMKCVKTPKSMQQTPQSLYDAAGFLRT